MPVSRRFLCLSASLFTLIPLCIFASAGCREKPKAPTAPEHPAITGKAKTFKCGQSQYINVDLKLNNAVDHQAIYVCPNDTVVWKKAAGAKTIAIQFTDCPFTSCAAITDGTTQTVLPSLPDEITVYKYAVFVDGTKVSDPHVIGGGGS
jgi:hypothetical protein